MPVKRTTFPALRCTMGDWIYYVTYFRFQDIFDWVKPTEEIHSNRKLARWIQRRLDRAHAGRIADYLQQNERFFSALVLGVYGGKPEWAELRVSDPRDQLTDAEEVDLQKSVGVLQLSGSEKLFAIDGQHRVAGIKKAVEDKITDKTDEVAVIFVAHQNSNVGIARTRRLFTTLNKTAKKVSAADIVALDEDNTFAVVTRRLIDECDIFQDKSIVSFAATSALTESDSKSITSVIGLYELVRDLYPRKHEGWPSRAAAARTRAEKAVVDAIYSLNERYWSALVTHVPEYGLVIKDQSRSAGKFRHHLLFRPVGQRAFAGAVQVLMGRKMRLTTAVKKLLRVEMDVRDKLWHYVLWNPVEKTILWKGRNRIAAESLILHQVGAEPRSTASTAILDEVLSRKEQSLGAQKD